MLDTIQNAEERQEMHQILMDLPDNESVHKCHYCKFIFDTCSEGIPVLMALIPKDDIRCPNCGKNNPELICKADAYSVHLKINGFGCRKGVLISGVDICPICHSTMCPKCMNHSVISWSRITGYLNDVQGWNDGKRQELMDRKRYEFSKPNILI